MIKEFIKELIHSDKVFFDGIVRELCGVQVELEERFDGMKESRDKERIGG